MKTSILIAALLIIGIPGACQQTGERRHDPPVTLAEYPTVDGSTSARPIARAVFLDMFGVPWQRVAQEPASIYSAPPEDVIREIEPLAGDALRQVWARIANHSGTHDAYTRLIKFQGDYAPRLILECRLPSVDERIDLRGLRANVELDCTPIARDAFIFIVREDCPVDGLTLDQVRGIFSGRITNWQEVGGADEPIVAITRNRNSGSQETMRHLVMCGRDTLTMSAQTSEFVQSAMDMFGPFGMLDEHSGQGIAYTFYSYWEHMAKRRKTKCLAINGVAPNAETIASGEYPLCTPVWAVIRTTEREDSPARRLREWLLSGDAQRIIEQVGYVPLKKAWPEVRGCRFEGGTYPRTDGSTSAHPLADMVALELLRLPWMVRVHEIWGIGNTPADGLIPRNLKLSPGSWSTGTFFARSPHSGTHDAWVRLIKHEVDLIFECRLPSEDERAEMERLAVEIDARPIAKDAFVFIMNEEAPIDGLTLEQIRDIFAGEITNWAEVGGPDEVIEPWQRNRNSGSQETMLSLVMGERGMVEDTLDAVAYDMYGPYGVLHAKTNAISFTFWSYHHLMMHDRGVKMLAVDGVYPTSETIASGAYPLVTDTYAAMRASSPPHSSEGRLVAWLLSEEGQRIIERSGYVSLRQAGELGGDG
jgi:phosphate transport system substrate-binding protein